MPKILSINFFCFIMKKLLILFIYCFIFLVPLCLCGKIFAWEDCPFGEKNCQFPGKCGAYIDTDKDSICDLSQPAPENRMSISEKENLNQTSQKRKYHLIPIAVISTIFYLFTSILSKKKIIKLVAHRKIWNFLLLISFFFSSILGILLIIQINSGLKISLPFNLLFWHAEIGIVMCIIGIYHIIWHWKYLKNIFKSNKD